MSPINVVILNDYGFINGGAAQVAVTTALEMARDENFHIYLFCAVPPIDPRLQGHPQVTVICTNQGDILFSPDRIKASMQGLWNLTSAKAMKELLTSLRPEGTIIHVHGWTKALSHSPISIAMQAGFPILLTVHDYFLACPNGGFYNYQRDEVCTLTAMSPRCLLTHCDARSYAQKLWRVTRQFIQKNVAHMPSRISEFIVLSHLSSEIMQPYLPAEAHIHYLPNPIETSEQERVEAEKNTSFIVVGRLSSEKGLDLFARAARELGVKAEFIGDGPIRNDLMKIYPEAHFTGWLSRHELAGRLRGARVLVFPSKLYEAQGLVISEAASVGIPSIISDITAGKELINDHETGLLFRANSQASLMEKMQEMMDNTLVQRLSDNVYQHFWQNPPTYTKYASELSEIYNKIIGPGRGIPQASGD